MARLSGIGMDRRKKNGWEWRFLQEATDFFVSTVKQGWNKTLPYPTEKLPKCRGVFDKVISADVYEHLQHVPMGLILLDAIDICAAQEEDPSACGPCNDGKLP